MATLDDFAAWLATGSEAGRDWNGWCQALMWHLCEQFGHRVATYPTATDAMNASEIVSGDPNTAPFGAFHYWQPDGEPRGHVALALGGGLSLMASPWVDTFLGLNVGTVDVTRYSTRTGSAYVGWAYTNGANHLGATPNDGGDDDMTPEQANQLAHIAGVLNIHSEAINEIRGLVQNIARAMPGVVRDAHGAHESADISAYLGHRIRDLSTEQLRTLRTEIDKLTAE